MVGNELDEKIYSQITALSESGDQFVEQENFLDAIEKYREALALIPKPIENWDASTWVLTALGETCFFQEDYPHALEYLKMAMHCPEGIGNPLIHLRLGQVQMELGIQEKAKDELLRAYMGGGMEVFEGEDSKYFELIRVLAKQS
jgi:tetratricopeptide (TPR) repeat protein